MEGVTTAIVLFIFFCVVYRSIVQHRPQFYAGLAMVVLILLVQAIDWMLGAPGFHRFVGFLTALLQIAAILALILSCGGVTPRELAGEMRHAFEVMRRGEEEKELIVPLTGEQPGAARRGVADASAPPRARTIRKPVDESPIPLDE